MNYYVGLFEGGYDPTAALVRDGRLLAFAEEERFLRNKHAKGWYPGRSLRFCLDHAGIEASDVKSLAVNWDIPSYTNGRMRNFFEELRGEWPVDAKTIAWQ